MMGCASGGGALVSVAFDPLARFPEHATYAWDRDAIRLPTDPLVAELHLEALIEEVAEEAFAARGYDRIDDADSARYHLSYLFRVTSFLAADASSASAAVSFLLVDPESKRRLWTGWGRADFYPNAPTAQRRERFGEAMSRMLENFPPRQSGAE
jgi:hypothetical protein